MDAHRDLDADRAFVVKLAYRMLGSTSEAEDVAQEAFLRWRTAGEERVRSPRAWLTRVATRLCLDRLKSAEYHRVEYVGEQLPEPWLVVEDSGRIDDSVSMALLATVQRLRPPERASFLLHDVFGYTFDEVADILGLGAAHCRQLAVRARTHLRGEEVRTDATPQDVERMTDAFFGALEFGDLERLERMLAADVVLRADGGGKVPAAPAPIRGATAVLAFLRRVLAEPRPSPVAHRRRVWFNGAPGVLVTDARGRPVTAFHFAVADDRIQGIYAQRNPDKLSRLAR